MSTLLRACAVSLLIAAVSCQKQVEPTTHRQPSIPMPTLADATPADFAGLHNVVAYADGVLSGSVPEGEEGFETLAQMGIRTIISVDGAAPDLEKARKHGFRYVHLPIGYNGMDEKRTLEIARAVRDLPGPVYVHCHHGKHRSAGAAGSAAVTLGLVSNEEALERMKVSGTAPNYTGLFQCVAAAAPVSADVIDTADNSFPETFVTTGLVRTMVVIDHAYEHLKQIEKAGWITPADHPDLVPAAEAGMLADAFRNLKDDERVRQKSLEFQEWLQRDAGLASDLEEAILADAPAEKLSATFALITASCKECHEEYRN